MKKIFCLFLILIFCAGCGTENTENKNSEPEPIKKTVEEQAKEMAAEGKFILAAEDFSNLQLTDVDKPVYDALGVWDRQEKNLPMALPDITPY